MSIDHLYHCLMESSSGDPSKRPSFLPSPAYGGGSGGSAAIFNLNINEDEDEDEWEPLFEKPLTPSDVGKLNRLVIPKQHAERYFPITGSGGGDPGEKGFILGFEDEAGKSWRFRYSYWNSSQSYVLTKGWSRFVKEKRLDAGDFVLFSRHRDDCDRLFIGWRRRGSSQGESRSTYPNQQRQGFSSQPQQDSIRAGSASQNQTRVSGNSRRVRLFGVNLECQAEESDPSTPTDGSGRGQSHQSPYHQHDHQSYSQDHMGWP